VFRLLWRASSPAVSKTATLAYKYTQSSRRLTFLSHLAAKDELGYDRREQRTLGPMAGRTVYEPAYVPMGNSTQCDRLLQDRQAAEQDDALEMPRLPRLQSDIGQTPRTKRVEPVIVSSKQAQENVLRHDQPMTARWYARTGRSRV
jgi:hypothetical protein